METDSCIGIIEKALQAGLPGRTVQERMAPSLRPGEFAGSNEVTRKAAVLILLYISENEIYTVLIRRTEYPGIHSGQISLPGGKQESSDTDIINTALRESAEEVGLDPARIRVLGSLSPLFIPASNIEVLPVVGYMPTRPTFLPDPQEVAGILEIPLRTLLDPGNQCHEQRIFLEKELNVPYYLYREHKIWGATAMILCEFLEIASGCYPSTRMFL